MNYGNIYGLFLPNVPLEVQNLWENDLEDTFTPLKK